MAGGQHRNFYFFKKNLLDSFKERTRARQRKKRQGFETCFPALLVGKLLFVNSLLQRQLPLAGATTLAPSSSNNTLAPSGNNSTSSTSNTRSSNDNFKKLKNLQVKEICGFQHEAHKM